MPRLWTCPWALRAICSVALGLVVLTGRSLPVSGQGQAAGRQAAGGRAGGGQTGGVQVTGVQVARDAAALDSRVLHGQVRVDDDSDGLLRRAKVTALGTGAAPVFTDQEGRFVVTIPARAYTVSVTKAGFAPRLVQGTAGSGDPEPVQVRLARGAAINGSVLDETGAPVADVRVSVRTVSSGAPRAAPAVSAIVHTDDRGQFRVGSLPAGSYRLVVESMPSFQAFVAAPAPVTNVIPVRGPSPGLPVRPAPASPAPATPAPATPSASPGATPNRTEARNAPDDGDTPPQSVVQVRAGTEVEVTIATMRTTADARAASSFVAEFEAQTRVFDPFFGMTSRGTASLTGRIRDPFGRSVVGAIVRLTPVSAGTLKITSTDAFGGYRFDALPAGAYRVSASRNGWLAAEYGQERVGQPGTIVTLRDRQRRDRVDLSLRRTAVISGIVTDQDGEVIEGLTVHVWRLEYRGGRPITENVARVRRTDDRGRYRIHGLQPGTYFVVASDDRSGSDTVEAAMRAPHAFYPGTSTLELATPVFVDIGTDAAGVDIVYTPSRTLRVTGTAQNSMATPVNRGVALVGSTRSGLPAPAAQMAIMNGLAFDFPSVSPGEYVIQALHDWGEDADPPMPAEFTTQVITIGEEDVAGVALYTTTGSTVRGRIVQQGGGRPQVFGNWLTVAAADPDYEPAVTLPRPWTITIFPDLTFQMNGLSGPMRLGSTSELSPRLWLKSADMGGINIADEPVFFNRRDETNTYVEVMMAGDGAQVTGRVVDARKEPVASFVVVAFPVSRELWYSGSRYIRLAQPDERSQFTLPMLPPGDFWIIAVDAFEARLTQNPEVLEGLTASARRVALSTNDTLTLELPLVRLRR